MQKLLALIPILATAALTACGSGDPSTGSGGGTSTATGTGGSGTVTGTGGMATGTGGTSTGTGGTSTGSTSTGSTSTGTGGAPPEPTKRGEVTVFSSVYATAGGPSILYNASASFRDLAGVTPEPSPCMEQGTCSFCTKYPSTGGAKIAAGNITVSSALASATLTPKANGDYDPQYGTTKFWTGGAPVQVQAAGGKVPPFSFSANGPTQVSVTAPAITPGGTLSIDTTKDLVVKWSGTSAGKVNTSVSVYSASGTVIGMVTCDFDVAPKQGVMPHGLLSKLSKTGTSGFSVRVRNSGSVVVGDAAIDLVLTTNALAQGGNADTLASLK